MTIRQLLSRLAVCLSDLHSFAMLTGVASGINRLKNIAGAAYPNDLGPALYALKEDEGELMAEWVKFRSIVETGIPSDESELPVADRVALHKALVTLAAGLEYALLHLVRERSDDAYRCALLLEELRTVLIPAAYLSHVGHSVSESAA